MKIDRLRTTLKNHSKEYIEGYVLCGKHHGSMYYYNPPYSPGDDRRTAWTRGWGDRQGEEMKGDTR